MFDTDPLVAPIVSETSLYIQTKTLILSLQFSNWYKRVVWDQYIDVKFTSGKEEGLVIMYGSTDLWASM